MLERRHFSTPELLRDLFLDFQTGVFCNCVLNSETPPFCQITEENELIICGKAKGTGAHRIENLLRGDFVIDFSKYDSIDIEAKKVKQHGMLIVLFTPLEESPADDISQALLRVNYGSLPSSYKKYSINISQINEKGLFTLAGGYGDSTGNIDSTTAIRNVVFHRKEQ